MQVSDHSIRFGMFVSLIVTALLVSACSDSTAGPEAEPDVSEDRGLIVFTDDRMIWRIRPDGSGLKAMGRDGQGPQVSPDLTRLGFTKNGRPGVANLDGSGLEYVDDGFAPLLAWVDENTLLLQTGDSQVTTKSLITFEEAVLYGVEGGLSMTLRGASLDPGGERLVVATYDFSEDIGEILLVPSDSAAQPSTLIRARRDLFSGLRFSPDGGRIVVERRGIDTDDRAVTTIIDVDDGAMRDVEPTSSSYAYRWPSWTPDGDSLLVNRYRIGSPFLGPSDLVVVSLTDGASRVVLADWEAMRERPHWSFGP